MNFTVEDDFIDTEIANNLYEFLIKEYNLAVYKSINFYDSKYDGDKLIDILIMYEKFKYILLEKHSNRIKYSHVFANSFSKNSRNIGMHSCPEYKDYYSYMLCRETSGGNIFFPDSKLTMHNPSQIYMDEVKLKHNRLIKSVAGNQRMMDHISSSEGQAIYINILR